MRTFTLFLFFLLSFMLSFGQKETPNLPIDSSTNKITYAEVINVDSLTSKQELYSRAREWFAKTYNSSKEVLQMEDKESGKIIGKALIQVYYKMLGMDHEHGYINYTITIAVKDGKYKYEITDLHHKGQFVQDGMSPSYGLCENMINSGTSRQKLYNYCLYVADRDIKNLIIDLKSSMNLKSNKNTPEQW